jgi:outer membrane protein assembly factor BamB
VAIRRGSVLFVVALVASTVALSPVAASGHATPAAKGSLTAGASQSAAPQYSWPEFHQNAQLTGYSADPATTASNAASLGVKWMTWIGAPALSSPVVAWNARDSETLVYQANEAGYLTAYNQATGTPVWSIAFNNSPIRSTPLVDQAKYLWVAPAYTDRLYKLNAATGAVVCSAALPGGRIDATPTLATPPGGKPTVYIGVIAGGRSDGPLVAVDEATCDVDFEVNYAPGSSGGIWDQMSYAVDATGEGLVLFGTADPNSTLYAVDAITGALVWKYATHKADVGAGITISLPGNNGFADGVAYGVNKAGDMYAVDLTTGALIWNRTLGTTITTPSLVGSRIVLGYKESVVCLNASTGATEWSTGIGVAFDSTPAVVGPSGAQVVVFGDFSGVVHALSLATGTPLYRYQTGDYITSSFADVDGNLIDASADGYLYDFTVGGGNADVATGDVTSPRNSSTVANPKGNLPIAGTATTSDGSAIEAVNVALQQGGSGGNWWDGVTGTWVAAPYPNEATLASPGSSSTDWSWSLPVPTSGGSYEAFASAVDADGVADIAAGQSAPTSARSSFTVEASLGAPTLELNSYWEAPAVAFTASGAGFANGETVELELNGTVLATDTANKLGRFKATDVVIPVGSPFGPAVLMAVGETSGKMADAPLYITNSWEQAGDGPSRQSFEGNDEVLENHLAVSGTSFATEAWTFAGDGSVTTSPAVADAVAYFADETGTVSAVDVQTGQQLWTRDIGGGSGIDSSPAVDPTVESGVVFVGAESGSVDALKAKNGKIVWSTSLGTSAIESSPAIADGVIYIGSDSGDLYAIAEKTGAVVWQTGLGSSVRSSPAVDPSANLVIVGDEAGDVTALSSVTGAVQWSFSTGGPVVATPLIYKGDVYVGSESDQFYGLNETTGAKLWADTTGGSVTSAAALLGLQLIVGDRAGDEYSIASKSGESKQIKTFSSAVTGVATALGFILTETASGELFGEKTSLGRWETNLGAGGAAAPVIVNGEIFATDTNGQLHCYTIPGSPPV